ncbi:substrate-binding domain-containing protein [Catenulispora yoronensis]
MSGYVASASGNGSITYVEESYARNKGFPMVKLANDAGYYTAPSPQAAAVALSQSSVDPATGLVDPTGTYSGTDPRSYPLSSVSYAIVPTSTNEPFSANKGQTLGDFLTYGLCEGAQHLDLLGYAPLPANLTQYSLQGIPSIPGASTRGADPAQCAAPSTAILATAAQPSPCDRVGATCGGPPTRTAPQWYISTTIPPGMLAITVPTGSQVTLPSPTLNDTADLFQTTGRLAPLTITDNRAGNPGWTLSGQIADFSDGATHSVNGQNLGWNPVLIDHSAGQNPVPGPTVAPAHGVAPNDVGTLGLKSPQVLVSTGSGNGLGTTHVTADLSLNVPTTTVAGTYVADLVLTAI